MSYIGKKPSFNQVRTSEFVVLRGSDITTSGTLAALNVGDNSLVRLTAATVIQGIVAPTAPANNGKRLTLINANTVDLTINHESGSATAANRITTTNAFELILSPNASVTLIYNTASSRWNIEATSTTTYTNLIISANNSSNALRITQTGSGNALVVEDDTNPDSTPFVIDSSGRMLLGSQLSYLQYLPGYTNNYAPSLQLNGGTYQESTISVTQYSTSTIQSGGAFLALNKSNSASKGSHTIVTSGQRLGGIGFSGSDGAKFVGAVDIYAEVDGTPGSNDMPGRMIIATTADNTASPTERMRIDSAGVVTTTGTQVINSNTSTAGLRVTQTGAGNALSVDGDSIFTRYAADSLGPIVDLTKSRNATVGGQSIILNNDTLGSVRFGGSDGTAFISGAQIVAQVDGSPSANDMPTRLILSTTADGQSTPTERMRIDSAGVVTTTGTQVITANTAAAALKITQTGSGNALLVEDSASIDSTPFVIDANGNVGIGKTTATTPLDVTGIAKFDTKLLMGGPNAFVSDYASGYNTTHTPSTPYEIGRFTFTNTSDNVLFIGEIRAQASFSNGTSRFLLACRSGATVADKTFSFYTEEINLGIGITVKVYHDTTTGLVVLGYTSASSVQNIGWSIKVQERTNSNYFQQVTALTALSTVGLTEITATTSATQTLSGNLTVTGDLTINGTTTTINTTNLNVEDNNITLNKGGTDATSVGAGITIEGTGGSTLASLTYNSQSFSVNSTGGLKVPVGNNTTNRPTGTATALKGMVRYNDTDDVFEGYNELTGWSLLGGGGTTDRITQVSPALTVNQVVYIDGGIYKPAIATSASAAEVVGIVTRDLGSNVYEITLVGEISNLVAANFAENVLPSAGDVIFLSDTVAGELTVNEPTTVGYVSIPLGVASGSGSVYFMPKRGAVVGGVNARTTISIANGPTATNVLDITNYNSLKLDGELNVSRSSGGNQRAYYTVEATKNGAGTWQVSASYTGDDVLYTTLPTWDVSGTQLQVTMPTVTNFTSASLTYALSAPAVGAAFPLTVDSTSINIVNSSPLSHRNLIINGSMSVDQRNAGTSKTFTAGANLSYSVDRWYGYCTGANVLGSRVASSAPNQYVYNFTGAVGVTGIGFGQRICAANSYHLAGNQATISVGLSNSLLTTVTWTAYYANSTDTFGTLPAPTRTLIATGTFTVSSVLTRCFATINVPAAATTGIEIVFSVGAQTSGTWVISDAQLEIGSKASAFERKPYETELQLCQSYYWKHGYYSTFGSLPMFNTGTNRYSAPIHFPTSLRLNGATITHNLTDGNYTAAAPNTGSQWSVYSPGTGYGTKTGTVTFANTEVAGPLTASFELAGAAFSLSGRLALGPTAFLEVSAEL